MGLKPPTRFVVVWWLLGDILLWDSSQGEYSRRQRWDDHPLYFTWTCFCLVFLGDFVLWDSSPFLNHHLGPNMFGTFSGSFLNSRKSNLNLVLGHFLSLTQPKSSHVMIPSVGPPPFTSCFHGVNFNSTDFGVYIKKRQLSHLWSHFYLEDHPS